MSKNCGFSNYDIAKAEADKVDEQIIAALKAGRSFRVEAGAGSGKTYSLNRVIEWIQANKWGEYRRKKQNVICITYTNTAVDVIAERLSQDSFILPSTIHSFAWSAIKQYQSTLMSIIDNDESLATTETDFSKVLEIRYTLGHRYVSQGVHYLHHNDVLKLFCTLLDNAKFRRVFSDKYPLILIDEYQDSYKPIVTRFINFFIAEGTGPQFGFFGDAWQTIYQTNNACGAIEHTNLEEIKKGSNFRSAPRIVKLLNDIRPDLPQQSAIGIEQRYGALVYIEPINRFTLACSMEKAYNSSENRYLHIGEKVYLRCTKDRSHQGWGVLTAIDAEDENNFTVEVTGGAFYMGETVNIYRDSAYNGKSCIGRGTVGRTQTVAITGEGSVLRMHVRPGDTVERGELLFETVKGTLDGLYAPDKQVVSPLNGVVAVVDATNGTAVDKDAKLVTVYPSDSLQIQMLLTEEDLSYIYVGKEALIEFNWDNQSRKRFDGAVSAISFVNREDDEANATGLQSAQYLAYLDFTPDETVRLGMTVTVYLQ